MMAPKIQNKDRPMLEETGYFNLDTFPNMFEVGQQ
jgi:hypothetical protein